MEKITRKEAYKRGFVIWEGDENNTWYCRSQNRNDEDYGVVYQIIK